MRRFLALMLVALCVTAPAGSAASATPSLPQVMGGASALGSPAVVALAIYDGTTWLRCSAALVRPRVLVTAAHCLTRADGGGNARLVRVFPPGVRARIVGGTGPRRPSPVRVAKWWLPGDYLNRGATVQTNDVAVILLTADLAPAPFVRLVTQSELRRWQADEVPVSLVGYGRTGARRPSSIPHSVALPLDSMAGGGALGATFSVAATSKASACPGDSGGPVYVSDAAGSYLIGTIAGANGACVSSDSAALSGLGFVTIGYLPLLNAGLAAGGYLTIPSAPRQAAATARNRDVTVRWGAPGSSPETVVGYDVEDASGAVVCQTDQLSCSLPGLPDGDHAYTVRSRNAQNEGDALPASAVATVASPPAPLAPRLQRVTTRQFRIVVTTLAGRTSAVVTSYVVRDQNGSVVCTVIPPAPDTTMVACPTPTARGSYTVSVHAETEMGPSPESPPSIRFTVR